jgi:hypothetical protein
LLDGHLNRQKLDGLVMKPATASSLLDTIAAAFGHGNRTRRSDDTASQAPRLQAGARVLVVEDNPVNQIVTRECLRDAGARSLGGRGISVHVWHGRCVEWAWPRTTSLTNRSR